MSARPLTREYFDEPFLRKPSLLLRRMDNNYVNHAQIRYLLGMVWYTPPGLDRGGCHINFSMINITHRRTHVKPPYDNFSYMYLFDSDG